MTSEARRDDHVEQLLSNLNDLGKLALVFDTETEPVKRRNGISGALGSIATAGGAMEAARIQGENARELLLDLFTKYGEKGKNRDYTISIPDDMVLLVKARRENLRVDIHRVLAFNDTDARVLPATGLRYIDGGVFGLYVEPTLHAIGLDNSFIEITNNTELSLRKLPEGETAGDLFTRD